MRKFPTGTWIVRYAEAIGKLSYNADSNTGSILGIDRESGWFTCGRYSRQWTRMYRIQVNGYELKAIYKVLDNATGKIKHLGDFRAILQSNGELKLLIQNSKWSNSHRYYEYSAYPSRGTLRENKHDAGYRHMVRFCGGGVGIKAFGAATMGNVEVRDLGSGWERHYAMVAGGAGASVGLSFPGSTNWVPCYLTPRCKNWKGATLGMYTAGAAAIVGYNECRCTFNLPNAGKWEANWSGWGVNLEAKVDLGTLVFGRLMGEVYSKPYFHDA